MHHFLRAHQHCELMYLDTLIPPKGFVESWGHLCEVCGYVQHLRRVLSLGQGCSFVSRSMDPIWKGYTSLYIEIIHYVYSALPVYIRSFGSRISSEKNLPCPGNTIPDSKSYVAASPATFTPVTTCILLPNTCPNSPCTFNKYTCVCVQISIHIPPHTHILIPTFTHIQIPEYIDTQPYPHRCKH